MSESRDTGGTPMLGAADETGFRRPLPDRGFSINGPLASATGVADGTTFARSALECAMDQDPPSATRRFGDWPLAVKTIAWFWSVYFLLTTLRAILLDTPGQLEMAKRRAAMMIVAMALCGLVYLLLRAVAGNSMKRRIITAALVALPGAVILSAANHYWFYIYSPLDAAWISPNASEMDGWPLHKIIFDGAHSWYFFIAGWAAIYVALGTARQLREADRRAALFAHQAQEAQLRALRYQINPHFLFNTLNSLSALVLARRNDSAERMLMNLSSFFRTTLAADPTADVPLSEEIRLQQLYLEIEQARFPDRLKVEIDVPDALLSRRVPVLILQPVVENAVKYGVARARRPVTLRISATEQAGRLHIQVADDGDGPPAPPDSDSTGVGLRNVCERLASRFGDGAGCSHGAGPDGGYMVHLFLPAMGEDERRNA